MHLPLSLSLCVISLGIPAFALHRGEVFPANFQHRSSSNTNTLDKLPATSKLDTLNSNDSSMNEVLTKEEELGFVDSMLGKGTQAKLAKSVTKWVTQKAKANPGCIERFVCESYRTGETLSGFSYLIIQLTNAAISFMVAEMFDQSIDIQEITRAARFGRTVGTCDNMKCDVMDGQLRTLGDFVSAFEEFVSSIYNSVSSSINFG